MKPFMFVSTIVLAVLAFCIIAAPVSALVIDVTGRIAVTAVDPMKGTITVAAPAWFGCNATSEGQNCSPDTGNATQLTGIVPDSAVFSTIVPGDQVIVAGHGQEGGRFLAIAKLSETVSGTWRVTDLFGEPDLIPVSLIGEYSVTTRGTPDCASCQNNICNALSANVTILSFGKEVASKDLSFRDPVLFFNGRNDASSVNVTFVAAEALPGSCTQAIAIPVDRQPVSNYIIHVVPPLGSVNTTAVATVPATVQIAVSPKTAAATTAKSGVPVPAGAIAAAVLGMLVVALKKT
ncbi:MAG: hypothetical protein ABFC24_08205 [Methanoregulaceae archaeon]